MPTFKEMEQFAAFTVSRRFGGAWVVENYHHISYGKTLEDAWERFVIANKAGW